MIKTLVKLGRLSAVMAALLCYSAYSSAAPVASAWLVLAGNDSSSNSSGSSLQVSPGTTSLDLYFDTGGDTSFGWDILLSVSGVGTISSVTGPFLDFGTSQPNGGWAQIGGDFTGETGVFLAMSFNFNADPGALINFTGTYTDQFFGDSNFSGGELLHVAAVPLPAAAWLFGSALLGLAAMKRKRA